MLSFKINFILLLIFLSGIVAIIGNYIGRTIGRRRIALFGLRPRYTAAAVTVLTGILIALITLMIVLIISNDARTAFFGLEKLKGDLAEKSHLLENTQKELNAKIAEKAKIDQELLTAQTEIFSLKKIKTRLGKEIEASRKGTVLFKVNETISASLIKAGPEKEKLKSGLNQIIVSANTYLKTLGLKNNQGLIEVAKSDLEETIDLLQQQKGEIIAILYAKSNTLFGETIPAAFRLVDNKLIYRSGEEISAAKISSALSLPEIEQEIKKLLANTHQTAKQAGILPAPSGAVGSVPYSEIYSLARKIKAAYKNAVVKTLAKKDIYTIGPLEIFFRVYY
ncbi:MAG: DUF3084 domain-containing protein [Candidatus Margulisbacteria bacterium]|nr:DUF3084 domain-containing protein [Candidatus Margulisiibacteriota bacterium]